MMPESLIEPADTTMLAVGDLIFEVRRSPLRKTMAITVDRGGELILSAPKGCNFQRMESFVREKRFWVYTKLVEKEKLQRVQTTREFVTGEGFLYLGRSYRLLLVNDQEVVLKLEQGRFKLRRGEAENGREHFIKWYIDHARAWINQKVPILAHRVGVEPRHAKIRDLGYRWGSCGKNGGLNFHWAIIQLPPNIVEYIIVHELVHLTERSHTPKFWRRIERVIPDFEARKQWLVEHGGEYAKM